MCLQRQHETADSGYEQAEVEIFAHALQILRSNARIERDSQPRVMTSAVVAR
jgi:hypothetical protein